MKKWMYTFVVFFSINISANATSWNEPWHKDVIKGADSLGLYKIEKIRRGKITASLIKHIIGLKPEKTVRISRFYQLSLTSVSGGHKHHHYPFKEKQQIYLFLQHHKDGYKLATPSAGSAIVLKDGSVAATFRHSVHQTKISKALYEEASRCVFLVLHRKACPLTLAKRIIELPLTEPVGSLKKNVTKTELDRFFRQHVAMETAYLIRYPLTLARLKPFLNSKAYHVQISAVRAYAWSRDKNKAKRLVTIIKNKNYTDIARVMAVIMLRERQLTSTKAELKKYLGKAPKKEVHLGMNIMDPRIGTRFPHSVKSAIEWYLNN